MKFRFILDKEHEEEVLVYAHKKTSLVDDIEKIVEANNTEINGFKDGEIIKIIPYDVSCFVSENNKVFALVDDERYQIKERIYQLEEILNDTFIKINQSCVANIKKIKKFSSTIGGAVLVTFDNDYNDYIARRELKKVKARIGI